MSSEDPVIKHRVTFIFFDREEERTTTLILVLCFWIRSEVDCNAAIKERVLTTGPIVNVCVSHKLSEIFSLLRRQRILIHFFYSLCEVRWLWRRNELKPDTNN